MSKAILDRRALRTRQALQAAFIELVLSRGYEALTAGEISSKANIGRSTFYLHYASKRELLAESMRNPSSGMAACVGGEIAPRQLVPLFEHFREQHSMNRTFFIDPVRSLWVKSLAALIQPRLIRPTAAAGSRAVLPRSLVAVTIAEMQIGLIVNWLSGRTSLKPEFVAAAFVTNTRALVSSMWSLTAPDAPPAADSRTHSAARSD